ncbi:putative toxin-antitoxin system toxin component, PIN family [Acidithiobacillus sp.]
MVGAVLKPRSALRQAFMAALSSANICASPVTLAELERLLSRDKFDRYLDRATRQAFLILYREHLHLFSVPPELEQTLPLRCRDARDDPFLALAVYCGADCIVSSDDDLLVMNPYQGIPVLSPREFLKGVDRLSPCD